MKNNSFKLSDIALDNRVTVYVLLVFLVMVGIMSYNTISKEEFPEVTFPYFSVTTTYPATSPEDIENLVTRPLEKRIKTVDGIDDVDSKSQQDVSRIMVKFDIGVDENQASQDLKEAVDLAEQDLPSNLDEQPVVKRIDVNEIPILFINLSGDLSLPKIKEYADDLQDEIEGLAEITRVDIVGALDREIQVNVDLYKMQAAGVTFDDIANAVARENMTSSAGKLDLEDTKRTVRIKGEFEKAEEITQIQLKPGIYIGDVAEVLDGFKERETYSRLFGTDVITLQIIKKSGENLIESVDKINTLLAKFKKRVTGNLKITVTGDTSVRTRNNLDNLFNTIILSFIIVVLVLMFFMGVENALFAGAAVPLSMCVAFIVVPALGFTMNVVVQIGFIIALGILVDNSIVVVENLYRNMNMDNSGSRTETLKKGVGEVATSILAGTLTTLAPFAVLCFWPGMMGKFIFYLPVTLIVSLSSSLFVAYVFNPVFASSFMKASIKKDNKVKGGRKKIHHGLMLSLAGLAVVSYITGKIVPANLLSIGVFLYYARFYVMEPLIRIFQARAIPAMKNFYRAILMRAIHGKRPVLIIVGVVFLLVFTVSLLRTFPPKVALMSEQDPTQIFIYITMPSGTAVEKTDRVARIMEEDVMRVLGKDNKDIEFINTSVARGSSKNILDQSSATDTRKAKVSIGFVEYRYRTGKHTTREYLDMLRKGVRSVPGAEIEIKEQVKGPDAGMPVNIEVSGEDLVELANIEKQILEIIKKNRIQGLEGLKSDLDINNPDVIVEVDRDKASRFGLSTSYIANRIRTALYGKEISQFRDGEDEYPITLRLKKNLRDNLDTLLNMEMMVAGANGPGKIPLSSVAKVSFSNSYGGIFRRDFDRVITLSSNVLKGYNANIIIRQLDRIFKEQLTLKEGYKIDFTGEQERQKEMLDFLSFALVVGIGLIFLILVTQFNSLVKPLIVLSQVLFSFIGIFLGIVIFRMDIAIMMTGMGIVAVGGIVVNNGILLIDYTDRLRERGKELREAIIESGATRLIPVLLTTISTILGLIPLAIGLNLNFGTLLTKLDPQIFWGGDNAQFWAPLAWTIIFGLVFATFLTLFVVPSMYYLTSRKKK